MSLLRNLNRLDNDEVHILLKSMFTPKQIKSFSRRLKVLYMLCAGKKYEEITEETGMSSAIIAELTKKMTPKLKTILKKLRNEDQKD